jgi:hypothetical protein
MGQCARARLKAARSNRRFADRRIGQLEAQLAEQAASAELAGFELSRRGGTYARSSAG